jgi:predicted transcriptional regulator
MSQPNEVKINFREPTKMTITLNRALAKELVKVANARQESPSFLVHKSIKNLIRRNK